MISRQFDYLHWSQRTGQKGTETRHACIEGWNWLRHTCDETENEQILRRRERTYIFGGRVDDRFVSSDRENGLCLVYCYLCWLSIPFPSLTVPCEGIVGDMLKPNECHWQPCAKADRYNDILASFCLVRISVSLWEAYCLALSRPDSEGDIGDVCVTVQCCKLNDDRRSLRSVRGFLYLCLSFLSFLHAE